VSVTTFAALEAAVQVAEDQWRRGDLVGALHSYTDILTQRVTDAQDALAPSTAADLVIMERLADLAVPCGYGEAADALLASMVALNERDGNRYGADYAALKRIHLALGCGQLRKAYAFLDAMHPSIGDLHALQFVPSGLQQWEVERYWPGTSRDDRIVLFSRLYLVMGRLLAALGQYGEALVALERGLYHTEQDTPDLAQQANLPVRLTIAGAFLEKGELSAASASLTGLEPDLDELQQPGFVVRWLELSGKLALLRGTFGDALTQFRRVVDICQTRGFTQAMIGAMLNLAHILIYLNHTRAAKELLLNAKAHAAAREDAASTVRATVLLRMAEARGHSLADGVPIAPTVSAMWGAVQEEAPSSADVYQEPFVDLPQSDNYLAFFEDRALGFHWQLGRRDWAAAGQLLANMQVVFGGCDSALIQVRLRVMDGMLAYYQDKIGSAALALDEVRPALADRGLLPELWQVQRFLGWCWNQLGYPATTQYDLAEHTHALLETMTASLSSADQAIFQLNKWTADEESIAVEVNHLARMKMQLLTAPGCCDPGGAGG
jgi:tetratricopeptide (TPR) repeat protein